MAIAMLALVMWFGASISANPLLLAEAYQRPFSLQLAHWGKPLLLPPDAVWRVEVGRCGPGACVLRSRSNPAYTANDQGLALCGVREAPGGRTAT